MSGFSFSMKSIVCRVTTVEENCSVYLMLVC